MVIYISHISTCCAQTVHLGLKQKIPTFLLHQHKSHTIGPFLLSLQTDLTLMTDTKVV